MPRLFCALLITALAVPARADDVLTSPDGRFAWKPGGKQVAVYSPRTGKKKRNLRLPPASGDHVRRKVLFAPRGEHFCLLDEKLSEVGLHLAARRGARAARALVVSSTLHLINADGRTLWKKKLPDIHALDDPQGARAPQVAADGTLAILLQDADAAHANPRPQLFVFDAKGKQRLRLDYLHWRRVDVFALSPRGLYLAVRGYGHIKDEEDWGEAVGVYGTRGKKRQVVALKDAAAGTLRVDDDGELSFEERAAAP
ncbi:MAG: hypothetical protein ABIJ96_02260 [Elusimicrobiota bacterium]